jgi:hypothetical protein
MPTPEELVAQAQLEAKVEWGTYVATGPIDINGVRAFNAGNAVPVSHVTSGAVDSSLVTKVPNPPTVTKAAVAAAVTETGS